MVAPWCNRRSAARRALSSGRPPRAPLGAGCPGPWSRAHNQALRPAVNRLPAVIPAAIVLIVAVSMGIGAALLGYPVWAIPLIAVFGAGGAIGNSSAPLARSRTNFPRHRSGRHIEGYGRR